MGGGYDEESAAGRGLARAARAASGRAGRLYLLFFRFFRAVVIHGNQALAGTTGTFCTPDQTPKCYTNTDPAAIFSTGKSFAALWTQTNASSSGNVYTLVPCIKTAGKWYLKSSS